MSCRTVILFPRRIGANGQSVDAVLHEVAEGGVDRSLALESVKPGKGFTFDDQSEMALAARIVAGVADMAVALILEIETGRSKRCDEALLDLGGDRSGRGGRCVHDFYIGDE